MGGLVNTSCCIERNIINKNEIKIVQRQWKKAPVLGQVDSRNGVGLKVMHWNILAQALSSSFPKVPQEYLAWEYRFELIMQHIKNADPDVIGLSEVDIPPLYGQLCSEMQKLGYSDYFVAKDGGNHGSAIFFKSSLFECLEKDKIKYHPGNAQFAMYVRLRWKHDDDIKREFVFAQTHLKAKPEYEEVRVKQVIKLSKFFDENYRNLPVIISGDFNDEPQSKIIADLMYSSYQDIFTLIQMQQRTLNQQADLNYPRFTSFKYRASTGYQKRTIDYIFIAENSWFSEDKIQVLEYLEMPEELELKGLLDLEMANPCKSHPSDHYSLGYKLHLQY